MNLKGNNVMMWEELEREKWLGENIITYIFSFKNPKI